ncbi:MarR family winged helix-turn-helix transcriptional regulator [Williamsia sterculiae]|uniref:DNA-binding transcriptional regulator, MarR family n=1 Tax=Williamsia sterculiae TaxID=1344003 RepID=A0A1N7CQR1_9NOCA|nr:MarR family transcriptional regulator [Williamsia sterculiae]SIR65988.1 DNA-binding transcriptional regulator, MarR family [Williamsia sterculiae]
MSDAEPHRSGRDRPAGTRSGKTEELLAAMAGYNRMRDRFSGTKVPTRHGLLETAAFRFLFRLADHPARSGELAEALHTDPSTVSRHIANLVDLGLVRREADPRDGRATVLVLTDEGRAKVSKLREGRLAWIEQTLVDWTDDEVATFTALLRRFAESAERDLNDHMENNPTESAPHGLQPAGRDGADLDDSADLEETAR